MSDTPPPPPPEYFRAKAVFKVPMCAAVEGVLFVDGSSWCFQVNPMKLADLEIQAASENGDMTGKEMEMEFYKADIKRTVEPFGIHAADDVYLTTDEENENLRAWTSSGLLSTSPDELAESIVVPVTFFAPLLTKAISQWHNLEPAGSETIQGEELLAWRMPLEDYNATFYYHMNLVLRWAAFEGLPGYGLLAFLPIKFDDFEIMSPGHAATQLGWTRAENILRVTPKVKTD